MHRLVFAFSAAVGLIGLLELIPGVFQLFAYLVLNIGHLLGGPYHPPSSIILRPDWGPGVFYNYHTLSSMGAAPLFLLLGGVSFFIAFKLRESAEEDDRASLQAEVDAKERKNQAEIAVMNNQRVQGERLTKLKSLKEDIETMSLAIPAAARETDRQLNLAQNEFSEGLLDPFWDAVESATRNLALIETTQKRTLAYLNEFSQLKLKYEGSTSIDAPTLNAKSIEASSLEELHLRLKAIIRKTQSSPDYTSIFHLRRTNNILVAGFSTFGQAINDLGDRLTDSIFAVTEAVERSGARIEGAITEMTNTLKDSASSQTENIKQSLAQNSKITLEAAKQQRKSDQAALDYLDNIQRGVRPTNVSWKANVTPK